MSKIRIVRAGETCEVVCINPSKVKMLAKIVPNADTLGRLSDIFQIMSDPNRLRILYCLSRGEVCVCDLSTALGMTVSAVSHQLRLLRALRLVESRRDGRIVYYSLADEHVVELMNMGLEHERE